MIVVVRSAEWRRRPRRRKRPVTLLYRVLCAIHHSSFLIFHSSFLIHPPYSVRRRGVVATSAPHTIINRTIENRKSNSRPTTLNAHPTQSKIEQSGKFAGTEFQRQGRKGCAEFAKVFRYTDSRRLLVVSSRTLLTLLRCGG